MSSFYCKRKFVDFSTAVEFLFYFLPEEPKAGKQFFIQKNLSYEFLSIIDDGDARAGQKSEIEFQQTTFVYSVVVSLEDYRICSKFPLSKSQK